MFVRRVVPRGVAKVRRSERGQVLILFVAVFTVLLVAGALAIDQGVFVGHRRVAQKDADTAARSGAAAYLVNPTDYTGAETLARNVATQNKVPTNANTLFTGSGNCIGETININGVPSIKAQINEPVNSLFSRTWGLTGIANLGANATACVGAPTSLQGAQPFFIAPGGPSPCYQAGVAQTGQACVFKTDSQPQDFGNRGTLSLPLSGPCSPTATKKNLEGQIATGSEAICNVNDVIDTAGGNNIGLVDPGINCRIVGCAKFGTAGEGFCDTPPFHDGNGSIPPFMTTYSNSGVTYPAVTPSGVDDFTEAFSLPTGGAPGPNWASNDVTLLPNVCSNGAISPRIMTIIIANACPLAGCGNTITVAGFATFYLFGCVNTSNKAPYPVVGPIDLQCASNNDNALEGMFVKAYIPEGGGTPGPPVPGASLSIFLVK